MSRCVLVAESDATELELIATVLARDGFKVLQALERDQAMSLFAGDEIALVIAASDVSGRGGGAALCSDVKKQKPGTRFVILHPSGNDPDARSVLLSRTGCDAVLPTPFRYDALKRLLGEWGLAAPPRPAAVPMSFAVPVPDVESLVAPPSVEAMVPEAAPLPPSAPLPPMPSAVTSTPVAVPIPIPVVFPVAEAPVLAEYRGDDEETTADVAPVGAVATAMDDEPTVDTRLVGALSAMDDEPTVEVRGERGEAIAEGPIAEGREPIADEPIAEEPLPDLPVPEVHAHESLKGDWLLAPPPADSLQDGFAGLDLAAGLDSAVDKALEPVSAGSLDLLSDLDADAARSVALAVQAYVAESMGAGDEPPPDPDAPALPPMSSEEPTAVAAAPELPPILEAAEPAPVAAAVPEARVDTWQVEERGTTPRIDTDEADAALDELLMPKGKGWNVVETRREPEAAVEAPPPPAPPVAEPPAPPVEELIAEATVPTEIELEAEIEPALPPTPPPPPPEVDRGISRASTGASSWSPSPAAADTAPARALPQPVPAFTPPPPRAPPPPPPQAAAVVAPPPPPPGALDEPPALPFEAIVQRTPIGSEPRTTLPPSVPPEGDLATTPLPRLLFELYGGTYCGTLRLSRKGVDRVIDVWNGFPVAVTVTPSQEDDDLATVLRDHGRITPEQYRDAKRRANGREAQLLVALGIIDERDLLDAIREQTELRMAASFSWRDGTYKVTPSRAPPDSVVLSEVHPVKIIWRGVCEHYDVGSLLAFFSPLRARYIVATEVFPIHYETLGPFLRSVGVAHLLNGKTTFEQALRSDDSHALTIAHTLYVLIVTEMIRAQSKPGEAATFPDAQAQARQSIPVDYRELTRACEEVARTYLSLKERDYFAMLELPRHATEKDVAAAYDKLAKPFRVDNLLPGLPDDVQRRAREIDQLLRRARDTLSSPDERRRYLTRLEDNQPPPPPADAMAS